MLISKNLHKKGTEVSIKTKSTPASLSFIGQVTKHTTVKWTIALNFMKPTTTSNNVTSRSLESSVFGLCQSNISPKFPHSMWYKSQTMVHIVEKSLYWQVSIVSFMMFEGKKTLD